MQAQRIRAQGISLVVVFALLIASVTCIPYVVGWLSTPDGWGYSGAPAMPPGSAWDMNTYLAAMEQGADGHWRYVMLTTHELHPAFPLLRGGIYLGLGHVADALTLDVPLVYHLFRFACVVMMVLALWAVSGRFFKRAQDRWLCVLLATIVGGWSWLLLVLAPGMTEQVSPIEFWLIDAFNLLGGLIVPHFALAVALQIVVVLTFDSWVLDGRRRDFVWLTVSLALEALIQPYIIVLLGTLLGMLALYHIRYTRRLSWTRALWLAVPFGLHAGLTLYQYAAMRSDPVWADFVAQNQLLSPPVPYYVLGFLPLLIPAAAGTWYVLRRRFEAQWLIPVLWVVLVAALLYLPFSTQRRYLLGLQTPLAILAATGWVNVIRHWVAPRWRLAVALVYFPLASISLLLMIAGNAVALARPHHTNYVFDSAEERAGFAWLADHVSRGAVVLTSIEENKNVGGRLVAVMGQRVFLAHWIETVNFDDKIKQVSRFYDPAASDDWRRDFLHDMGIRYVWYDDTARATGDWNPHDASYLTAVFEAGPVTLFQVQP